MHTTEEEKADGVVRSEEIGDHKDDEKINESEKQEGDEFGLCDFNVFVVRFLTGTRIRTYGL